MLTCSLRLYHSTFHSLFTDFCFQCVHSVCDMPDSSRNVSVCLFGFRLSYRGKNSD